MVEFEYKSGRLEYIGSAPSEINEVRICDYIEKWNKIGNELKNGDEPINTPFQLRVVYHSCKKLYGGDEYMFSQEFYTKENIHVPTVHLTLFDIFSESDKLPDVRRYKKIIDSSIWNYYVPIEIKESKNFDFNRFNHALEEISYNTKNGLYNLAVANEYADINARLTEQSYLKGNHKAISPFLFHSEKEMQEKIKEYKKDKPDEQGHAVTLKKIKEYRWRFLLLDDKSIENLSSENNSNNNGINKLQIIANNLSRVLEFTKNKIWFRKLEYDERKEDIEVKSKGRVVEGKFDKLDVTEPGNDDVKIVIDCVEKVADAEACLKKYRYEIVLLDYLLDNEYGYELLERLREKRNQYNPGPNNRFFFMFISAFHTAVHERMLEKGFGRVEPSLWFIGNGACPTNTPYLFSYQLLLMMCHRINDLKNKNEGGCLTLIELLDELYVNEDNAGLVDVRQRAHEQFNSILFMRNKYHNLERDLDKNDEKNNISGIDLLDMKSSFLIQSAFQYVHLFSGAMFEHLQHLVYLTAYGTIRQWTELWEEYVFIHKILIQYDKMTGTVKGRIINKAIRDYIIELKENSN